MATLTIRNLPDDVRDELRMMAARNGRSVEAEVRGILAERTAAKQVETSDFSARVKRIQRPFSSLQPSSRLASDELIAERRLEAVREDVEANGWRREHDGKTL